MFSPLTAIFSVLPCCYIDFGVAASHACQTMFLWRNEAVGKHNQCSCTPAPRHVSCCRHSHACTCGRAWCNIGAKLYELLLVWDCLLTLRYLNRAMWYTYVISINKMHTFYMNVLILVSSTCFEHLTVHPQDDFLHAVLWNFFMHPYKYQTHPDINQPAHTDACKDTVKLHLLYR